MTRAVPLLVAAALLVSACDPEPRRGEGRVEPGTRRRSDDPTLSTRTRPFRFAVIGDAGKGSADQYAVAHRMCAEHDRRRFEIVLTTGDNVYPTGEPSQFDDKFFIPFDCLVRRGVRFRATLGNHDILAQNGTAQVADERFGMPERNYTFAAAGVRFVMLDSNRPEVEFLEQALRDHADARWTIVAFHHPVYSPGPHGSDRSLRSTFPELFRRYGVDLVLTGHDHLYAVTEPLDGIRYVVTGGGGAGLYKCFERAFAEVCRSRHHFVLVTVRADRLDVAAIPPEGPRLHAFTTAGTEPG